jgi:hypothetical protein
MLTYALESPHKAHLLNVTEASPAQDYFCPECKDPIRKRQGQHKPHFYHYQGSLCKWSGVGLAHLKTQFEISARLGGFLEKRFNAIERIADLFIPSHALVIEVQYSPISLKEVLERNWDYSQIGLLTLWILQTGHPLTEEFDAGGALAHVPHYFCDMDNPVFCLYDLLQGEIHPLSKPRLLLRKATTPFKPYKDASCHTLWQRLQLWKCHLRGDRLDQYLHSF